MNLWDDTHPVADIKQRLHSNLFEVWSYEAMAFNMVVHILVHYLSRITVVNETVAEFIQELEGCDFDTVELTISEKDIDRLLGQACVLSQEVIVKNFCE